MFSFNWLQIFFYTFPPSKAYLIIISPQKSWGNYIGSYEKYWFSLFVFFSINVVSSKAKQSSKNCWKNAEVSTFLLRYGFFCCFYTCHDFTPRNSALQPNVNKYNFGQNIWEQRTTEKFQFLIFSSFFLASTKLWFWKEGWPLGYNSMKLWDFSDFS